MAARQKDRKQRLPRQKRAGHSFSGKKLLLDPGVQEAPDAPASAGKAKDSAGRGNKRSGIYTRENHREETEGELTMPGASSGRHPPKQLCSQKKREKDMQAKVAAHCALVSSFVSLSATAEFEQRARRLTGRSPPSRCEELGKRIARQNRFGTTSAAGTGRNLLQSPTPRPPLPPEHPARGKLSILRRHIYTPEIRRNAKASPNRRGRAAFRAMHQPTREEPQEHWSSCRRCLKLFHEDAIPPSVYPHLRRQRAYTQQTAENKRCSSEQFILTRR
ncbi:hypothetical protein HPB48_005086 [Haemaphysalis longicornis]|uniref:Uncharacterized protein n=1 Tax=Haemaphysalis longicornis TaxID=44386 RepID=A0A9J6FHB9_HAELO|nr:hypothetical protein HPB48_005086 [Haemaphysalis longicornis]